VIFYVCRRYRSHTIRRFLKVAGKEFRSFVRLLTYEDLCASPAIPTGHYIFSDFDRLTPRQIEHVAAIATMIPEIVPGAQVLNHPLRILERYALLRTLARAGLNPNEVARLDEGRELRFPIFIRRERGADGPETGLLYNAEEYEAAMRSLAAAGRTIKGRIAVEFIDARGPDRRFRKFSALRVAERIVPIHLHTADDWVVKSATNTIDAALAAEEYEYVRDNPHRDDLMHIFKIARTEFGRIDYAIVDGRVVTFEINTNPTMPGGLRPDARVERRELVHKAVIEAYRQINTPLTGPGVIFLPKTLDVRQFFDRTLQRLIRRQRNFTGGKSGK
jgi:hypothetical protein